MNKYDIAMSNYFSKRLRGIIHYKHLINEIDIFIEPDNTYGSRYMRVYFDVKFTQDFESKPIKDKQIIYSYFSNDFSGTGHRFVSYLIEHTQNERREFWGFNNSLKRYKEFYDCYNYHSVFITNFLTQLIGPHLKIRVESPDIYPDFNYLQKFWHDSDFTWDQYQDLYDLSFEESHWQHKRLIELVTRTKENQTSQINSFLLTDSEIENSNGASKGDIRSLIIDYQIPIKIEGFKTIDIVHINIEKLEEALNSFERSDSSKYRNILPSIIYRQIEKARLNLKIKTALLDKRKQKSKNKLDRGDMILSNDDKVFKILDANYLNETMTYKVAELKKDMSTHLKDILFYPSSITKYLKSTEFQRLKEKYKWYEKSQIKSWLLRKGKVYKQ